jgi:hypothetical protein
MGLGRRLCPDEVENLTAADTSQRYHKLPGRRRGFISSASLWTGADYLLSVKSDRLREDYKRFYFRDIQAIVITKVPRFAVSTRALALGATLLIAILIARRRSPGLTIGLWLLAAGLVACWIYICAAHSCACRLYTAVSREDLPSIYRMWTARKVLAELEPRIEQAQGVFTESWAEAADLSSPGPPRDHAAPGPPGDAAMGRRPAAARSRTLASDLFLASLFADAIATGLGIGSRSLSLTAVSACLTLLQLAGGIWILVQHYRGILSTAMQRLAIVTLVFIGGVLYVQAFADSVEAALAGRRGPVALRTFARSETIRPIYIGGVLVLGLTGLVLSFKSFEPEPPPAITG